MEEQAIWYILVDQQPRGPYTPEALRSHGDVTPDTLVWREGFEEWKPLRDVEELKRIFRDGEAVDEYVKKPAKPEIYDQEVLTMEAQPPYWFFWILLFLFVLLYVWFYWG